MAILGLVAFGLSWCCSAGLGVPLPLRLLLLLLLLRFPLALALLVGAAEGGDLGAGAVLGDGLDDGDAVRHGVLTLRHHLNDGTRALRRSHAQ